MDEGKTHKRSGSQPVRELASRSAQASVMSPVKSSKVQGSMSANNTSVSSLSSKRALRQVAGTSSSIKRYVCGCSWWAGQGQLVGAGSGDSEWGQGVGAGSGADLLRTQHKANTIIILIQ